jgi:hypothetical protein
MGFVPVGHVSGAGSFTGQVNRYYVPSTDNTALFLGDPVVKHGDYYAVMRVNLIEYGLKFEKTVLAKFRTEKQAEAEISRRVDRDEEERIARRRGYKRQYDEDFKERRGKQIKRPHQVSKLLPSTFVLERTSRVEKPDNGNQANGQGGA